MLSTIPDSSFSAVLMIQHQLAAKQKDTHYGLLFTYLAESFALILETNSRFLYIAKLLIMWCRYNKGDMSNVEETSYFTTGFALHEKV